MSYEDDKKALKIHGYEFSDDSSSAEDSKSILDEDYYKWKPPPIPIKRFKNRIVKIKSNPKFEQDGAKTTGESVQQNVINKRKNNHKKAKNTWNRTYVNSNLSSVSNAVSNLSSNTSEIHHNLNPYRMNDMQQRPVIKIQSPFKEPVENFKVPTVTKAPVTKVPKNILINAKNDQQKLFQGIQPLTSFKIEDTLRKNTETHGQPLENQNLSVAKPSTSTNYRQNQNFVNFVEQPSTLAATGKWIPSKDNPKPSEASLRDKRTGAIPKRKIETTPASSQMENVPNSFIFEGQVYTDVKPSTKQPQNHQQPNKSVAQPKLPILHGSTSKSTTKNPITSQDQPTVLQQINQNQQKLIQPNQLALMNKLQTNKTQALASNQSISTHGSVENSVNRYHTQPTAQQANRSVQKPPPKQLVLTNKSQANNTQPKSETHQVPLSNQSLSVHESVSSLATVNSVNSQGNQIYQNRPKSVQSKHDDKLKSQPSHRKTQELTINVPDVSVHTPISRLPENSLSGTNQPTQPTPREQSQSTDGFLSSICDIFTCFCCISDESYTRFEN